MKLIFVVEDDPIVLLDVSEGLRAAFPEANIRGVTLDDALAQIADQDSLNGVALISEHLPSDGAQLAEMVSRGLCLIFTSRSLTETARMLPAVVVDRPFDPATFITILSDCNLTVRV